MRRRRQIKPRRSRGRPRKLPVKMWRYRFEPAALGLLSWITSPAPSSTHREVCRVLIVRLALLRAAVMRSRGSRRMPRRALLRFLERATIATPRYAHGGHSFPLLPGARLSESTAAMPEFNSRRTKTSLRRSRIFDSQGPRSGGPYRGLWAPTTC